MRAAWAVPRQDRKRTSLATAIVAVAVLIGLSAYLLYELSTKDVAAPGGTAVEGLVVDGPLTLLPPFAGDTQNSRDVASLLYRGLTRTGSDASPQPELAASWDVDQSAKTFTFHLRPGLTWSDGAPLTSDDAAYTLSLLQSDAVASSSTGQAWAGVTIATPDPRTIVYTLPAPSGPFLAQTSLGLVPAHALKNRPAGQLREVVDAPTSGPFAVSGIERDRLHLVRNLHASKPALLDGLDFRLYGSADAAVQALSSGEIDAVAGLSPADATRISHASNRHVLRGASFAYVQLLFNQKNPVLADVAVRRALSLAIDRRRLISGPLMGYAHPDDGPIPPTISWAVGVATVPAADPAGARQALDAAGWRLDPASNLRKKGDQALTLNLAAADLEPYKSVASGIRDQLAAVGVKAQVSLAPQARLVGQVLEGRNFDMIVTAVDNGPDPDIYVFWHSSQAAAGGFNFSGMPKNVFLDKDLEDGRATIDMKARRDAYADALKLLKDNTAAVYLYSPDVLIGLSNRLRGVRVNPGIDTLQRFEYAQEWYVNTRRVRR